MADEDSKIDGKTVVAAAAAVANSKAAEKLASAVEGLVQLPHRALDLIVGPKRITAINEAHATGALLVAKTEAEIERIRAETAEFVLDREMRKTLNRQAILAEAQKALPKPGEPVSDEPVSRDFVHAFFEEFDGISDPEVHKIVGRLLTNEVTRPGSFPRRTMRVLRDLESRDFATFTALCRFCWNVPNLSPIIFNVGKPIYVKYGLTFDNVINLQALGLVSFETTSEFTRTGLPPKFLAHYGAATFVVELKANVSMLELGSVIFTDAGERLAPLTCAQPVPGFVDYVLAQWQSDGHTIETLGGIPPELRAPTAPAA
jgi:hypothetical protein